MISDVKAIDLSSANVTVTPAEISEEDADYIVRFELGKSINATDTITITLPAGTTVTTGTPAASIVASPGWLPGPVWGDANVTAVTWAADGATNTITATLGTGDVIGEAAEVRIEITDSIENPDNPGDYTLTVKTSEETTAVTSATYAIGTPTIDPLSGIVQGFNSAGILMKQSHEIWECIAAAGIDGRVEVGPGTYTVPFNANVEGQTIIGTGAAGTSIIKLGTELVITGDDVTLDGLTIGTTSTNPDHDVIQVDGVDVTITNCEITAGAYTYDAIDCEYDTTTISNCTIDLTAAGSQWGIEACCGDIVVTDCTINVGTGDVAIVAYEDATITGTTITGSSGVGVLVDHSDVDATIDSCTFTSLEAAVEVNSGDVWLKNSVIDGCGTATHPAIWSQGELFMVNNTVQNSGDDYAVELDGGFASIHFNSFLNNPKNIMATGGTPPRHFAANNWYGSADGPAPGSVVGLDDGAMPYLGNSVTGAAMAVEPYGDTVSALAAEGTVGVDVAILPGAVDPDGEVYVIGVAEYTGNPELAAPQIMGTGSVLGYYDVFVVNDDDTDSDRVQIKFYVPVSPYTKVYYAGGISGRWADAGGDVNLASGFAYVTVGGVDAGLQVEDLGGTVFAIVEDKAKEAGPVMTSPNVGDYDVAIEPMFTWDPVGGSIRYEIALSEDPTFTIIEWSYNVDQNFYKVDEPLRYDTTYYWRVRGVLGEPYQQARQWVTPSTPWTTGIFTTASEPEPPPDPIVVQPTKPEVNVEIPPTKITIEPAEQAIPNYMLWIIVAVGAVLVIALIVLIVRTRRVV
jgi:hypothetical protein